MNEHLFLKQQESPSFFLSPRTCIAVRKIIIYKVHFMHVASFFNVGEREI